jgi:hypothetical protein
MHSHSPLIETFQKLSTIIEQDATDNTYKYALLRATSEICQEHSHLIEFDTENATLPIGLVVEKWVLFYWTLFENEPYIPQMPKRFHGERRDRLQFRDQLVEIILHYQKGNGLSQFYSEYLNNEISKSISKKIMSLFKKIRYQIRRYPMKHLGKSVYQEHYMVFKPHLPFPDPRKTITRDIVIQEFGKFSIPIDYYQVFNILGGYIIGDRSIFTQWARKTEQFTNKNPNFSEIFGILLDHPVTSRQIQKVKRYYSNKLKNKEEIRCTWSGKKIESHEELNIDHMFPFSKYKNNDLWNLVPSLGTQNSAKKDRIPAIKLLEKRRRLIVEHWKNMRIEYPSQFDSELKLSLLGYGIEEIILEESFKPLIDKADYLINYRKYEHWNG